MKFSTQALLLAMSFTSTMVQGGDFKAEDWSLGCRRQLESLGTDTLEKCATEEYTLHLAAIKKHLVMLAEPAAQQQDCPSLAFHAIRTKEDSLVKLAHEYADDEDLDKLELGTFALENIVQAHTVAPAGSFLDKYSFFHNNCGSFLIKMGEELGINPNTPSIVGFVRDQLSTKTTLPKVMEALQQEEEGVELIKNHYVQTTANEPNTLHRFEEGMEIMEPKEEKAIVGDFVATYIEEHASTITIEEESGAMTPAASVVAAALASAAGAFIMMV